MATLYVNQAWASLSNGEKVTVDGIEYTFGTDAFATITKAVAEAQKSTEKVTIVIAAGNYTENVIFSAKTYVVDGVTYAGGIEFKAAEGADVNITGQFWMNSGAKDIKDVSFDGLDIECVQKGNGYYTPIGIQSNASVNASGISVTNCTLTSVAEGNGVGTEGVAFGWGVNLDGAVITGNTIKADCGIYTEGAANKNVTVSGNTIYGREEKVNNANYNGWAGVYITKVQENVVISGNTIQDTAYVAVRTTGGGATITNNTISECRDERIINASNGSVVTGNTLDGKDFALPANDGSKVFVSAGITGKEGDSVICNGVTCTIGTDAFASISAAIDSGAENIVILSDITDSVESLAGITLSTTVPGGVKVTNTYNGYLYLSGGNQIGENITWDNTQGLLFAYNDNTVNGNILVYLPYTRYDGTLTIGTTGSMTFTEQFVIRYADSDTEPLLSIQGTAQLGAAAEDRTAQLISKAGYITFYSGIVEASNTLVNGGHLAMNQTTDAFYSDKAAVLNLDNTIWNFSSNDANSAYLDGKALINAENGSVLNFNDDLIINGAESGLSVTDSVVNVFNGGVTNNGTISVSGESTLNIQQLTGNGSIKLEDGAVITDSTIGGGTVALQGTATFKGVNSIGTLSVSGYNHNLIIGTDGSLKANGGRTTLSYGSTIDVDGTIENAKTADKANLTKSLEITGGFSFNGNGTYNGVDATLNVDNAYVSFGSSTSKNSGATGNFVFNFTNSIVDFTADFQTAASTVNTLDPYFSLNVKDSVFSIGTRFAFSHKNSTAVIDNSLFSTAAQFKNVGEFTLQNGSVMTVGSNADGPSYEKTGNFGTLNIIDSVFDFSAAATSAAYAFYNAGTVYVDGGEFYSDYVKNEGSFVVTDEGTVEVKSFTNNGTITIDVAEGWTGAKVVINAQDGTTFGNVVLAEEDALAGVQYRVDSENGDLVVYNVNANTFYVDADYTGAFGEDLGDGKYFGINVFANLNDAVAAAADGNTLQLSGTISGSAAFANGKNLTITGEAEFTWADGWFFVGRGANDAVDTTVTFRDAVISEGKEYAWNIGTGFNVAQSEGEGSGKANGTLNIENSKIITTYLANRNIVNVKGDGIEDGVYGYNGKANLTVLNGFYVSRDNDDELNAEMNLTDGAYVRVEWENAMGIGYGNGRGVLNITDSKFEAAGDQVLTNPGDLTVETNGTINVTNGELTVQNNLRNNGSININNSSIEATKLVNNGIVAVDLSSAEPYQFKVDTLVNNGTLSFTFDAGMEIEGGMMLLVDTNSATEYGEVIFNGISDDYDAVVIDGDLYAFDTKKIYVNAAYASYSAGDEIAEGIYFGINAFASLETIDADLTEAARTIEFTYNGSEAMEITVTSAGSSILTYNFEGQNANFISGSRTHTISEEGVYTFDFAKGDFELATRIFELNESEEITGDNIADEEVTVNEYAGNKEYTFEVGANTTGKLTCTYEDVDGTVRAQVFDADGNVVREKLFNRDGSFVVADLEEGSYKVVFSGYGSNPDAEFTTSFEYVETAIADFTKDDTLEGSNVFSYLAGLEVEDKVGGEDSVDWFRIEDIESGSYNLSFDTEGGDGLQVALYNEIDGVSKSISTFFVNDKKVDAADYIRKAKVAADADLLIKVSGRGDETKYAITFNPVV